MGDPNTFTGADLDRAADGRRTDSAWVNEQLSHERARAVVAADSGVRLREERLELVLLREAPASVGDGVPVLLGLDGEGPVFAVDEGPVPEPGTRPALVGAGGRRGEPAADEDSWHTAGDDGDGLLLPPRSAIARRLIEGWLFP